MDKRYEKSVRAYLAAHADQKSAIEDQYVTILKPSHQLDAQFCDGLVRYDMPRAFSEGFPRWLGTRDRKGFHSAVNGAEALGLFSDEIRYYMVGKLKEGRTVKNFQQYTYAIRYVCERDLPAGKEVLVKSLADPNLPYYFGVASVLVGAKGILPADTMTYVNRAIEINQTREDLASRENFAKELAKLRERALQMAGSDLMWLAEVPPIVGQVGG